MEKAALTLSELHEQIKISFKSIFPQPVWITAEISELNINSRSGHCYLELIEKSTSDGELIAKTKAMVWAYTFKMLKPYFESTTGHEFTKGIKILARVSVEFHTVYGYSLNIVDIDPTYTLGDIEIQRLQIIKQLTDDGIIDMNKELPFPNLPQRIAIISSATAAGYGDFTHQLKKNEFDYKFYYKLFPAVMQGESAPKSIVAALEKIFQHDDLFDVVVIIRGGGSKTDLMCFDNYLLAANVAQFPLPVLTGIGHERDDSIVDMVAHLKLKTPTAVAEYLIDCVNEVETYLLDMQQRMIEKVNTILMSQKSKIELFFQKIPHQINTILAQQNGRVNLLEQKILSATEKFIKNKNEYLRKESVNLQVTVEKLFVNRFNEIDKFTTRSKTSIEKIFLIKHHQIEMSEEKIKAFDPLKVVQRGYSLTLHKGKIVKDANRLKDGDFLTTILKSGKIESTVNKFMQTEILF